LAAATIHEVKETPMLAQINHMAISSHHWPMLSRFYEAVFGLRNTGRSRPMNGATVGDGYVGLNINPVRDGQIGGLDHFGIMVDDANEILERARKKFPEAAIVKRPSTRPFAAYSGHDPDGNIFDLAERDKSKLDGIYADQKAEGGWSQERYLNKFAIRTMHAEKCADFFMEVFEFKPINTKARPGSFHMTDGRVTLSIMPWSIPIFLGTSIKRPGPDHIGFKVESLDAFKQHVTEVVGGCSYLAPMPIGGNKEAEARKAFIATNAAGKYQLADPDGTWIDVTDE
jgi:catechol 2,3-dioxygenase-like lactoylglutathione lyase family enzyme